jgi:hypothetical protein
MSKSVSFIGIKHQNFGRQLTHNCWMTKCTLADVSLHQELTNPANLYNSGSVDRLLLGLCQQPAQNRDEFITEELTNHLFQTPSMYHELYFILPLQTEHSNFNINVFHRWHYWSSHVMRDISIGNLKQDLMSISLTLLLYNWEKCFNINQIKCLLDITDFFIWIHKKYLLSYTISY